MLLSETQADRSWGDKVKKIVVALVGQPNVGKSHLLNSISGANLKMRKLQKSFWLKANDIILNVLDSTNLERNLSLTSELLELDKRMVVALNMDDEAIKEGIFIDEKDKPWCYGWYDYLYSKRAKKSS